jgi:DNA repair ATPase RecN
MSKKLEALTKLIEFQDIVDEINKNRKNCFNPEMIDRVQERISEMRDHIKKYDENFANSMLEKSIGPAGSNYQTIIEELKRNGPTWSCMDILEHSVNELHYYMIDK